MKHMSERVNSIDEKRELIERYKATSKYLGCILDIMCQKQTSSSVSILKCIGVFLVKKYLNRNNMR